MESKFKLRQGIDGKFEIEPMVHNGLFDMRYRDRLEGNRMVAILNAAYNAGRDDIKQTLRDLFDLKHSED